MNASLLIDKLNAQPVPANLWNGTYKIPWNDPEFSRRMLREHLTQEHDLASRKAGAIAAQTQWLHDRAMDHAPGHILDLACGPGLYAAPLADRGHRYQGIDFGPAAIEHGLAHHARAGQVAFRLGDVTEADFGGPYALVTLLYGEINVFPPDAQRRILAGAFEALLPGGRIALEVHTFDAVRGSGQVQSWYAAPGGLFSDDPHLCLTRSQWFEEPRVARQEFHVLEVHDNEAAGHAVYHSTMQAWTDEEYEGLLRDAGFVNVAFHDDWPSGSDQLRLIMGMK